MFVQVRPAPPTGLVPLWFTLLGGHAAWTLHLLLSYFLVSLACLPGPDFQLFGRGGYLLLIALLTVATTGLALGATIIGWHAWRRNGADNWPGFLAFVGMLLSGLFLATIIMQTAPLFFLDLCPATR